MKFCRFGGKHIIVASTVAVVTVFGLFPLLLLVGKSFLSDGSISFSRYIEIFSSTTNIGAFKNTVILGLGVVVFTTIIGVPLGWLVSRTDLPRSKTWRTLFSLPYIVPPYIGAIAWIELANPKMGYLNRLLGAQVFNIYSMGGMIWILGFFLYTFMFLATVTALEQLDPSFEEAARMSGARGWRVVKDITIPLILPSLIAGAILTFVAACAAFGVPAMVGMPNRIHVLTTKIYALTQGYEGGIQSATSLSVILMLIALFFLVASGWIRRKKRYTMVGGKSSRKSLVKLGAWRKYVLVLLSVMVFVIIVLPFLTILLTSFQKVYGRGFGLDNFTFKKYIYVLFGLDQTTRAIFNSFKLAVLTATVAVFIGTLVAYIKVKTKLWGRDIVDIMATLPYATPGVVVALGMIIAFSGGYGLNLYNTMAILLVAYFVKYLSFAVRTSAAAFEQVDNSMEEAGWMSGAGWFYTLRTILIPIIKPALIAGWFLIFMPCFSELTMSILLFGPDTEVIGTVLYNLQAYDDPQAASVLAVIVVSIVLIANWSVKAATKGRYGF